MSVVFSNSSMGTICRLGLTIFQREGIKKEHAGDSKKKKAMLGKITLSDLNGIQEKGVDPEGGRGGG